MNRIFRNAVVVPALLAAAYGQTSGSGARTEFEAASIHVNPPPQGFHFASDSSSGGPGSTDPGTFRCSNCKLAALIGKAFNLRNYQFPGKSALGDGTFDVTAKIPEGATQDEFLTMLQNLLKERFGLAYHFKEKTLRGYHLVIARNGSKLKESSDTGRSQAAADPDHHQPDGNAGQRRFGAGEGHSHTGLVNFGGSASYRGDHQTAGDLARLLSDQIGLPVDDQTGLAGAYDITLSWTGDAAHSGDHADGAWGGGGHADHGGGAQASPTGSGPRSGDASGPTLFDAVQSQLGLKLVPAAQSVARIFVVDRVEPLPTAN